MAASAAGARPSPGLPSPPNVTSAAGGCNGGASLWATTCPGATTASVLSRAARPEWCQGGTVPTGTVIVTPGRCWLPQGVAEGRRLWGIAAQLYLLRSETNWGIGDFGDLHALVELAAANGADVIGLNPLHALFPDNPEHASPYSPASRLLLNVLNIEVTAIPELRESEAARRLVESEPFREQLESCRDQ